MGATASVLDYFNVSDIIYTYQYTNYHKTMKRKEENYNDE